jgi:hypothetical protein
MKLYNYDVKRLVFTDETSGIINIEWDGNYLTIEASDGDDTPLLDKKDVNKLIEYLKSLK